METEINVSQSRKRDGDYWKKERRKERRREQKRGKVRTIDNNYTNESQREGRRIQIDEQTGKQKESREWNIYIHIHMHT